MRTIKDIKITYVTKVWNADKTLIIDKVNESSYSKEILSSIKKPLNANSGGFSYEDIKSIDRVEKAFSKIAEGEVKVEEPEYEFIKKHLENQTWITPSIEFVNLIDYIKNLKED